MTGMDIEQLIRLLARLPGLGPRSARRAALHLFKNRESLMIPLSRTLEHAAEAIAECPLCHTLDTASPCSICADMGRDGGLLCVVQDVADLWAIEKTGAFRGTYHVLGGTLSALDGVGPEDLSIPHLVRRVRDDGAREVILALGTTIDGQATSWYIADALKASGVRVTQLASGVPVGGRIDHLDDGTLQTALKSRKAV